MDRPDPGNRYAYLGSGPTDDISELAGVVHWSEYRPAGTGIIRILELVGFHVRIVGRGDVILDGDEIPVCFGVK